MPKYYNPETGEEEDANEGDWYVSEEEEFTLRIRQKIQGTVEPNGEIKSTKDADGNVITNCDLIYYIEAIVTSLDKSNWANSRIHDLFTVMASALGKEYSSGVGKKENWHTLGLERGIKMVFGDAEAIKLMRGQMKDFVVKQFEDNGGILIKKLLDNPNLDSYQFALKKNY